MPSAIRYSPGRCSDAGAVRFEVPAHGQRPSLSAAAPTTPTRNAAVASSWLDRAGSDATGRSYPGRVAPRPAVGAGFTQGQGCFHRGPFLPCTPLAQGPPSEPNQGRTWGPVQPSTLQVPTTSTSRSRACAAAERPGHHARRFVHLKPEWLAKNRSRCAAVRSAAARALSRSVHYRLTQIVRRWASDALLHTERRAARLEHRAVVAEHRLEIEQRDNAALRAQVALLMTKPGVRP